MNSLNRGEWSELYSILFLIIKPKLQIVDEHLNYITSDIFEVKQIIVESRIELKYELLDDMIFIYADGRQLSNMDKSEIDYYRRELLNKIMHVSKRNGAFEIPSLNKFLETFSKGHTIKRYSNSKSDVRMIVFDRNRLNNVNLSYSIKSSLGRPATILNASRYTDFKYRITNFDDNKMKEVNSINTKYKLIDRLKKIKKLGGIISFEKVKSNIFDYNLQMIDSNMPLYLANAILYSYEKNKKFLKEAFLNSNNFKDIHFGEKKLGDFLIAASFGLFPGTKWDGNNEVTGGILLVKADGDVVLLDLIYYPNCVKQFLINETKLESPSSARYHMLDIKKENGNYYFTLNLQVRYKN